jgi:hypothetical protein
MMNFTKIITTGFLFAGVIGTAFGDDLSVQIQKTRSECTGISDKLDELKRKAGIGVVATGAGTVSGGVALGTGIAKSKLDSKIRDWKSELNDLVSAQSVYEQEYQKIENMDELLRECNSGKLYALQKDIDENKNAQTKLQSDIDAATDKSKTLGNIRTGTLAGTAVADTAGVLLAAGNKVDDDLKQMVEKCILDNPENFQQICNSNTRDDLNAWDLSNRFLTENRHESVANIVIEGGTITINSNYNGSLKGANYIVIPTLSPNQKVVWTVSNMSTCFAKHLC